MYGNEKEKAKSAFSLGNKNTYPRQDVGTFLSPSKHLTGKIVNAIGFCFLIDHVVKLLLISV